MNTIFLSKRSKRSLKHIAIIMDGNGRWAQKKGLPRIEGHRQGAEKIARILERMQELSVPYLTLYAFSVENWKRPSKEVNALMDMLEHFVKTKAAELLKNKIRLKIIGRLNELPKRVQIPLKALMRESSHFNEWTLVLALNYGARTELIDAVKTYTHSVLNKKEKIENLDWNSFSKHLYTSHIPDPDLIIRTSGETRLSNFLLMQSAYSEFYFTSTLWPDFTAEEFEQAIASFNKRERRYGRISEQVLMESHHIDS